jgi:hypothetical protein
MLKVALGQEHRVAEPKDTKPAPEWVDDDPEIVLTMDMDDEDLDFDEFPERGDEMEHVVEAPREHVPLWRLIEMSREDRSLKMELADFDQYDEYENIGDLSH